MATNQRSAYNGSDQITRPPDGAGMAHPTVVPTNFEPDEWERNADE
ncbi:hypothetical protein [Halovivax gelatinilyticus]|nr:hypothetical protein [Halovivax gelatinilyticus]